MNSKMVYSLTAFAIAVYAIGFMRSDLQDQGAHRVYWQLIDGQLVDGPQHIALHQGQKLTLTVLSNQLAHLELQGYEQALQLTTDSPQTFTISLQKSGRFKLILQPLGRELGSIDVQPE